MDMSKFEQQHEQILQSIEQLRDLIRAGVEANAAPIAALLTAMSSTIRLHLAVEDSVLYPALLRSPDASVRDLAQRYQSEMSGLLTAFSAFVGKWRGPGRIAELPQMFRDEANGVFRALHDRIGRENRELYPALAGKSLA